ncbi:hypothetical protein BB558_000015 [Smittium angustum]|uniref:Protein kinase domain-containing protein n=1 Tax=Smittium angustum TaxID=133377 RepID=A0A2U1JFF5_SMIAN|nr:hypothetical protein BB558_000015 [Smittium angustum]
MLFDSEPQSPTIPQTTELNSERQRSPHEISSLNNSRNSPSLGYSFKYTSIIDGSPLNPNTPTKGGKSNQPTTSHTRLIDNYALIPPSLFNSESPLFKNNGFNSPTQKPHFPQLDETEMAVFRKKSPKGSFRKTKNNSPFENTKEFQPDYTKNISLLYNDEILQAEQPYLFDPSDTLLLKPNSQKTIPTKNTPFQASRNWIKSVGSKRITNIKEPFTDLVNANKHISTSYKNNKKSTKLNVKTQTTNTPPSQNSPLTPRFPYEQDSSTDSANTNHNNQKDEYAIKQNQQTPSNFSKNQTVESEQTYYNKYPSNFSKNQKFHKRNRSSNIKKIAVLSDIEEIEESSSSESISYNIQLPIEIKAMVNSGNLPHVYRDKPPLSTTIIKKFSQKPLNLKYKGHEIKRKGKKTKKYASINSKPYLKNKTFFDKKIVSGKLAIKTKFNGLRQSIGPSFENNSTKNPESSQNNAIDIPFSNNRNLVRENTYSSNDPFYEHSHSIPGIQREKSGTDRGESNNQGIKFHQPNYSDNNDSNINDFEEIKNYRKAKANSNQKTQKKKPFFINPSSKEISSKKGPKESGKDGFSRFGTKYSQTRSTADLISYSALGIFVLVFLIFWVAVISSKICNINALYTSSTVAEMGYFSALGIISNLKSQKDNNLYDTLAPYKGNDVSEFFIPYENVLLSNDNQTEADSNLLKTISQLSNSSAAELWLNERNSDFYRNINKDNVKEYSNLPNQFDIFLSQKVGSVLIYTNRNFANPYYPHHYIFLNEDVYNMTTYFKYCTYITEENGQFVTKINKTRSFLGSDLSNLIFGNKGLDISTMFNSTVTNPRDVVAVMRTLFHCGTNKGTLTAFACTNMNTFGWFIFVPSLFLLVAKVLLYFIILKYWKGKHAKYGGSKRSESVVYNSNKHSGLAITNGQNGESSSQEITLGENNIPVINIDQHDDVQSKKSFINQIKRIFPTHNNKIVSDRDVNIEKGISTFPQNEYKLENYPNYKSKENENVSSDTPQTNILTDHQKTLSFDDDVILVTVIVFDENLGMITSTIQSIARSSYPSQKTALFIVFDGNLDTLQGILREVAYMGGEPEPKMYGSQGPSERFMPSEFGEGSGGNRGVSESSSEETESYLLASVYSGIYECGTSRVPYVIVAKQVYQGHVDSLMMITSLFRGVDRLPRPESGHMKHLSGQNFSNNMASGGQFEPQNSFDSPWRYKRAGNMSTYTQNAENPSNPINRQTLFLEDELDCRFWRLGMPISRFSYCLVIDAGTEVEKAAIEIMAKRMKMSPKIMGLQGQLKTSIHRLSITRMVQSFQLYFGFRINSALGCFFGAPSFRDRGFTLYRVWFSDNSSFLGSPDLMADLVDLVHPTLHNRHLWWQNGNCLLDLILRKRFPNVEWGFDPLSKGWVNVHASLSTLDAVERQWFKSKLHLNLEQMLQKSANTKVRFFALYRLIMQVIGPSVVPIYFLMACEIIAYPTKSHLMVAITTGGSIGFCVLLFVAHGDYATALFFFVYLMFGLLFYYVWIPLTSIFSMNRVWTSPNRISALSSRSQTELQIQPKNKGKQKDIDEYTKIDRIGEGAFGIVYRAKNKKTNEISAIKRMHSYDEGIGFPLNSLREIKILQQTNHINLVKFKSILYGNSDSIFMEMEYCYQDMGVLLDNAETPFDLTQVKCLMKQLLTGIDYCHQNGLIHRDLKLSNIMLTNEGILKIGDFGLSRYCYDDGEMTPGVVTLWYRAPEVIFGSYEYTNSIDICELEQLELIVSCIGSPNPKELEPNKLATMIPLVSHGTLDLLSSLLKYLPNQRISASDSLSHYYFDEIPKAVSNLELAKSLYLYPTKQKDSQTSPNHKTETNKTRQFEYEFDIESLLKKEKKKRRKHKC